MKTKITLLFYILSFSCFSQNFIDPQTPSGTQPENNHIETGWTLDFSDEFKGSYVNTTKWNVDNSTTSRTALPKIGVDYWFWKPSNVAMDGENLVLKVTKENSNTMFCGSVNSRGKYSTQYGYIEVRVKLADTSKGTHTAFWLQGLDQGKVDGTGNDGAEIDVFESAWLNDYTQITMHIDGYKDAHQSKSVGYSPANMHQGFHTWGLLWTKDSLTVYFDGNYMTSVKDIKWIPWNKEYLWLSDGADFILSGDSYFKDLGVGPLTEAYIDYVRVWKKTSEIPVGNNALLNGGFDNQYNSWNCTNAPTIENNTANCINGKTCVLPILTGGHVLRQVVNVKPGRIYNFGYKGRIQDAPGASGTQENTKMIVAYYPKDSLAAPELKGMILDQDYNKLLELKTDTSVNKTLSKLVEIPNGLTSVTVMFSKYFHVAYLDDVVFSELNDTIINGTFTNYGSNWTVSGADMVYADDATTNINGRTCRMTNNSLAGSLEQLVQVTPGKVYKFSFNGRIQSEAGASGTFPNSNSTKGGPGTLTGCIVDTANNILYSLSTQSNITTNETGYYKIPDNIKLVHIRLLKDWNIAYVDDVELLALSDTIVNGTFEQYGQNWLAKGASMVYDTDQSTIISGNRTCRMTSTLTGGSVEQMIQVTPGDVLRLSYNGRIQNSVGASGTIANDNTTKGVATLSGIVLDASGNVLKEMPTQSNSTKNVTDIFSVPEDNNYITVKIEKNWNIGYIDDISVSPVFDSVSNGGFGLQGKGWTLSKPDIQFYNDTLTNINGITCRMPDLTAPRSIEQYMLVSPGEEYLFSFKGRIQDAVGASGYQLNSTNAALVGQILTKNDQILSEISTVSPTNQYLSTVLEIPDTVNFVKIKIYKSLKTAYIDDVSLFKTQGSSDVNTIIDNTLTNNGLSSDMVKVISGKKLMKISSKSSMSSIQIFDLTGRTVMKQNYNSTTNEIIYLNDPGLYIVDVKLINGTIFKLKTIIY